MFPEMIQTQRLLLRRPLPSDADAIFQGYAQDHEVTRYVMWVPHTSVENTRAFIANCDAQWTSSKAFPYAITRDEDGKAIGMIDFRPTGQRAEFGYVLARPHWGQGLMPEAASALIAIALAQPSIFRVQATCDVENRASARVLEKAGLSREGVLRKYVVHPNISAEPRDSLLYAITR